ncbi:type VI secretion system Vgr family protein [Proteus sp. NMG38-2]|uniref:type VI secretion system Vgr family protein n=1 Tax=Proteus sp. NMG38-2 TaxID=2883107 RepID=UPI001D0BD3AA|nr:type VI secretion system tip protein TssI/VgrG [Proteus sp. NMG38-2]UDN36868.1 type VI secretion system tip protein VgrG [Proteus sp. NMG38-2]
MSTNDANNTPKPRLVLDDPASSRPFEIGMTFSEQQARIKKYSELLDTLGKGLLHTGLVFTCQIGDLPKSTFQVTQFDLNEGLSELFTLSIHAVSEQRDIDFANQLGVASSLTVSRDGKTIRTVQGLLASAEQGNTDGVKTWYQFVIRPEMWVMTLNQDSRIFQHKTVPQILQQLLDEAHIKYDNQLYQPELHQTRRYITQKRESAYAFWCRLAFEEGINFWFEEGPKLFYSDNHLGMTAGITLTYNPQAETDITDTTATTWRYTERLCSDVRIDKDYNPIRPSYPLSQNTTGDVHQQHPVFESYGRFQEEAEAQPLNQLRYEQSQNYRQTGSASTNCFALMPGKVFTLTNHPSVRMNSRWQVISVSHHGVQPSADNGGGEGTQLSNNVTFIPGTQEWRPPFHYKPLADGDELATVVGPEGEEIYTNEQGAVKVYFHWDRRGKPDHSGSCWLRVAQGWNGDGFGFMAIPRIGQEVIVSYLNGDIDRPIITGCTYNGRNAPPLDLPKEKTQTTFRTKTHKGTGFNELRFEDAGGREEVYLHAQRDQNTHINHNKFQYIGKNESHEVANDRKHEVCHNEFIRIVNEQTLNVGVNQFEQIGKDRITRIDNHWKEVIHASHFQEVGENKQCDIQNDYKLTVAGGIHSHTKVHTLQASETMIIKGKSGSIQLDAQGVTITGNITLRGNVSIVGGAPEVVPSLEAAVNEGLPLSEDCRAKALKQDTP